MNRYEVVRTVQEGYSVVELRDTESGEFAQLVPKVGGNFNTFFG
jgi:hypothetical protein